VSASAANDRAAEHVDGDESVSPESVTNACLPPAVAAGRRLAEAGEHVAICSERGVDHVSSPRTSGDDRRLPTRSMLRGRPVAMCERTTPRVQIDDATRDPVSAVTSARLGRGARSAKASPRLRRKLCAVQWVSYAQTSGAVRLPTERARRAVGQEGVRPDREHVEAQTGEEPRQRVEAVSSRSGKRRAASTTRSRHEAECIRHDRRGSRDQHRSGGNGKDRRGRCSNRSKS